MPPASLTRAGIAPTPPAGTTTYTSLVAMIVGVIIAVLSLFDVVPTAEDVSAIGTIVGAVIALVAFVVSAISRTKQANNLAKIAADEREHLREWPATTEAVPTSGVFTEHLPSTSEIAAWGESEPAVLGAPTDLSQEVQFGSVRPPGVDVGGEAPAPADEPAPATTEGEVTP